MAIIEKKEAFIKQITLFLDSKNYKQAYDLAKQFVSRYPDIISYFILAKCAFWNVEYDEMLSAAGRACEYASGKDRESCVILTAAACYKLGRFEEGYGFLEEFGKTNDPEVAGLRFMLAAASGNRKKTEMHLDELFKIDKKKGEEFILLIIGIDPISSVISNILTYTPVRTKRMQRNTRIVMESKPHRKRVSKIRSVKKVRGNKNRK